MAIVINDVSIIVILIEIIIRLAAEIYKKKKKSRRGCRTCKATVLMQLHLCYLLYTPFSFLFFPHLTPFVCSFPYLHFVHKILYLHEV